MTSGCPGPYPQGMDRDTAMAQEATPEPQAQEAKPETASAQGAEPTQPVQDVETLRRELDRLQAELRQVREEAARRRVEKKSVEERLQEMEQTLRQQQERAIRAEARAALIAELGDPAVADAAMVLAREAGYLSVGEDGVRVDVQGLLSRFPFLRPRRTAPQDAGASPTPAPTVDLSAVAQMSVEEYAQRRDEILKRLLKGGR